MKTIAGKKVRESLCELVDPKSTVVVLVDLQNDFVGTGGLVETRGEGQAAVARGIVSNTVEVVGHARAAGIPIVYVRYARTRDHRFESPASLRWTLMKRGYTADHASAVENTWGAEIVPALAPRPGDLVFDKRRASGFFGTPLDEALRGMGIQTIVVAGVSTHGCVEATARDAELRDYYVVVLRDCVGAYDDDLHEAALKVMASRYDVVDREKVFEAWRSARHE